MNLIREEIHDAKPIKEEKLEDVIYDAIHEYRKLSDRQKKLVKIALVSATIGFILK